MKNPSDIKTTVVTAGDRAYSWGAYLLAASMRMNGMPHPVVVGAMGWKDEMKRRIAALGNVTVIDIPPSRQCVACQKPMMMMCDAVKTDWVCWADADGMFVGDCSEWLVGDDVEEIVVRKCIPPPPQLTPECLEIWRKDVEKYCGRAREKNRYDTTINNPFIVIHRKWFPFLERWQRQINSVLPKNLRFTWQKNSPYFQSDESVLGSLVCFDPDAPKVVDNYKANGSVDRNRYYAHFAYYPKPWQMWNTHTMKWHDEVAAVVDWLLEQKQVTNSDLPFSLRRGWWPFNRRIVRLAPWVWRAIKLKRKLF